MMAPARRFPVWLILLASAGTLALTMGIRQTMGLFLSNINTATSLGIGSISLAFAFGQLWWGLTQPFAGAMADKYGSEKVLVVGIIMIAAGTFLTPFMTSTFGLIMAIGVLAAGGAGMAGPAVLMATATRMIPAEKRGIATGVVNAGGSFGQFVMAPLAGSLMATLGWITALQVMAMLVFLAAPAILVLKGKPPQTNSHAAPMGTGEAIKLAFAMPSYLMLGGGFFVCGFHVAFLATHLPGVITSCGLPGEYAAWSLGILGLFNIVGSLSMGWAVGRWRMKSLLSLVYTARGVAVVLFLLAPKTGLVMLIFAAVMGVTYLSTVPPTVGLVAKFFGPANMATLYGIVMFSHQVGAFLGAWLGGRIFATTGSFNWLWYIDVLLAVFAALIHLPIREKPVSLAVA